MAYTINLGGWGSVFAVPSMVVDKGLKLASETQLKVLLYILRNNDKEITDESLSEYLGVHPQDIRDSIEYWSSKGLLVCSQETLSIPENVDLHKPCEYQEQSAQVIGEQTLGVVEESEKSRPVSRAQKPEFTYVTARMKADKNIASLMNEAVLILGRILSRPDMATLLMLHETDGLPVEVILMLLSHCVSIGRDNMKYIEKTGINWGSEGICTVELADEKIKRYSESTTAWNTVVAVFGLRNNGSPTQKQLEFAGRWVNEWRFSEKMLRLAYERCVDAKGEVKLPYINGILKRWFELSLRNPDEVIKSDAEMNNKKSKKSKPQGNTASYDIDAYESKSIFDD